MSQASVQTKSYTEDDYYRLPENIRAELIYGQFYNMSAPSRIHQQISMFILNKIANYIDLKNGSCEVYTAPFAVKLFKDDKTIVEPDISVICDKDKLTDKGCTGAPDWIIEITSPSSAAHDHIRKLNLYLDAGVREYWIVNPMKKTVTLYYLDENNFEMDTYTFQDIIKVNIYDDLWIDLKALDL